MIKNLLTAAFVILLASEVQAQCFKPKTFQKMAAEKWHERVTSIAITRDGMQLRVYTNQVTKSWTITVVHPNGRECALSAGDRWQYLEGAPS